MKHRFPFVEGAYAGIRGADPRECPYVAGEAMAWHRGHGMMVTIFYPPADDDIQPNEPNK